MFLIAAGPWAVAAIGGVLSHSHDAEWIAVAAPSPFYVFAMMDAVKDTTDMPASIAPAGVACALGWGLLGLVLLGVAGVRSRRTVAQHAVLVAQAEAALREEEKQNAQEATAPPAATPP
jgi:hypothetical protein